MEELLTAKSSQHSAGSHLSSRPSQFAFAASTYTIAPTSSNVVGCICLGDGIVGWLRLRTDRTGFGFEKSSCGSSISRLYVSSCESVKDEFSL